MIKGAKYSWGGKWFTFIRPHATWKNYGWFCDDAGQTLTIRTDVFEAAKPKEPEPFTDPERWALSTCSRIVFCDRAKNVAEKSSDGKTLTKHHNAEVDRLMREIRRLEALVGSRGGK